MSESEFEFTIHRNPDSPDLWPLVCAFRAGTVTGKVLSTWRVSRSVRLIEWEGARYVLKHDLRGDRLPWEKALQERLHKPFYSRLMRSILAARKAGCRVVRNIHLVAERMEGGVCREAYLVLEYVEGTPFAAKAECLAHAGEVEAAMRELHRFDLALGDMNHKNFVLSPEGRITIIDLSSRGFVRLGKVKDAVRMRLHYAIRLPLRGIVDRLLFAGVYVQQQIFYRIRLRRNGKTNPLRPPDEKRR